MRWYEGTEKGQAITRKIVHELTLARAQFLRDSGYTVVEKWEHEAPAPWTATRCPEKQTETYPYAIVYDFESYQDKSKASNPTRDLSYESEHVPISVSIADTFNPEPEYIVAKDPNELIHLFYQSLERRHAAIVADVEERYCPPDPEGIPTTQGNLIMNWINQVPVVGFNSGHYDLKLIRKYFVPVITHDKGIFAAEKNGRIMFINTPKFKFLDVMNYLAPGITYDKWVKTYGPRFPSPGSRTSGSTAQTSWITPGFPHTLLGTPNSKGLTYSRPKSTTTASASSKSVV